MNTTQRGTTETTQRLREARVAHSVLNKLRLGTHLALPALLVGSLVGSVGMASAQGFAPGTNANAGNLSNNQGFSQPANPDNSGTGFLPLPNVPSGFQSPDYQTSQSNQSNFDNGTTSSGNFSQPNNGFDNSGNNQFHSSPNTFGNGQFQPSPNSLGNNQFQPPSNDLGNNQFQSPSNNGANLPMQGQINGIGSAGSLGNGPASMAAAPAVTNRTDVAPFQYVSATGPEILQDPSSWMSEHVAIPGRPDMLIGRQMFLLGNFDGMMDNDLLVYGPVDWSSLPGWGQNQMLIVHGVVAPFDQEYLQQHYGIQLNNQPEHLAQQLSEPILIATGINLGHGWIDLTSEYNGAFFNNNAQGTFQSPNGNFGQGNNSTLNSNGNFGQGNSNGNLNSNFGQNQGPLPNINPGSNLNEQVGRPTPNQSYNIPGVEQPQLLNPNLQQGLQQLPGPSQYSPGPALPNQGQMNPGQSANMPQNSGLFGGSSNTGNQFSQSDQFNQNQSAGPNGNGMEPNNTFNPATNGQQMGPMTGNSSATNPFGQ